MPEDTVTLKTPVVVHTVITVARQIEGEYVFVMTDKGFIDRPKAEARQAELKKHFFDEQSHPKPIHIKTPNGEADCYCEVGIFDVEIDPLPAEMKIQ